MISGISNDPKKFDKYFNGTTNCALKNNVCLSAIFGLAIAATSFVVNPSNKLDLYLNEDESFHS